jgi:ADP-ribose pyrophosphatase YjhB (NUDIX family)
MTFELLLGETTLPENSIINERVAVRAVIFHKDSILMVRTKKGDYKFPGGGVKQEETKEEALIREVAEETGYVNIKVGKILGVVTQQHVDDFNENQYFKMKSLYFLCELEDWMQVGQKLDDYEAEQEFTVEFVSLQKAIDTNQSLLHKKDRNTWVDRETKVLEKLLHEVILCEPNT